jgi:hypothetical protein
MASFRCNDHVFGCRIGKSLPIALPASTISYDLIEQNTTADYKQLKAKRPAQSIPALVTSANHKRKHKGKPQVQA